MEKEKEKERERKREREREYQINGVRDGALNRNRGGVHQEMAISGNEHLSIFSNANQ
jgi:hypothetical protein